MTKGVLTTPAGIAVSVVLGMVAIFGAGWKARDLVDALIAPAKAQTAQVAPAEIGLLRQDIRALTERLDKFNERLSHLEGATWSRADAR